MPRCKPAFDTAPFLQSTDAVLAHQRGCLQPHYDGDVVNMLLLCWCWLALLVFLVTVFLFYVVVVVFFVRCRHSFSNCIIAELNTVYKNERL